MFFTQKDGYRYSQPITNMADHSGNVFAPLEIDTEYQTPKYPYDTVEKRVDETLTVQVRGIHEIKGTVYAFNPIVAQKIKLSRETSAIFDYIKERGYDFVCIGPKTDAIV